MGQRPGFNYNRERPDPFYPFLSKEIIKAEKDEAKARAGLPGAQKFEPSQLLLVAIVATRNGFVAMVQDSAGAGYVLRKGTKIGEHGRVVQISKDKVIVEQSVKDVFGKKVVKKIEMMLNKEGEK